MLFSEEIPLLPCKSIATIIVYTHIVIHVHVIAKHGTLSYEHENIKNRTALTKTHSSYRSVDRWNNMNTGRRVDIVTRRASASASLGCASDSWLCRVGRWERCDGSADGTTDTPARNRSCTNTG